MGVRGYYTLLCAYNERSRTATPCPADRGLASQPTSTVAPRCNLDRKVSMGEEEPGWTLGRGDICQPGLIHTLVSPRGLAHPPNELSFLLPQEKAGAPIRSPGLDVLAASDYSMLPNVRISRSVSQ